MNHVRCSVLIANIIDGIAEAVLLFAHQFQRRHHFSLLRQTNSIANWRLGRTKASAAGCDCVHTHTSDELEKDPCTRTQESFSDDEAIQILMRSACAEVIVRRKVCMIKYDIAVLQLERHAVRIDKTALKTFLLPLVAQRSVDVLQVRVVHVPVADRFNVKVNDDISVFQKDRRMVIQPIRATVLGQVESFRYDIRRCGQAVIAIGESHPLMISRSSFPPLHTVRDSFPSYGVPSCMVCPEPHLG